MVAETVGTIIIKIVIGIPWENDPIMSDTQSKILLKNDSSDLFLFELVFAGHNPGL